MRHVSIVLLPLGLTGCLNALDVFGQESVTTQHTSIVDQLSDDRIEDKHPVYDPERTTVEEFPPDCSFEMNKSATVTKLDIVPLDQGDEALKDKVFRNRAEAAAAVGKNATLIPSMEAVNGELKPANDGIYAAIELAVEQGLADPAKFPSKRDFLVDLLAALQGLRDQATSSQAAHIDRAMAHVGAGLMLGGGSPALSAAQKASAEALVDQFNREPIFSKPIGFYSWTPALEQIFRQDRFLQNYQGENAAESDEEFGQAAAMALAIQSDASLGERYQQYLALYAGLTNPYANVPVSALAPYLHGLATLDAVGSLRSQYQSAHPAQIASMCGSHFALFPSSQSKETTYFEKLGCEQGAAPSNYMDALINGIQNGLVNLAPSKDSGWYDYQSYALETLLLPDRGTESQHLLLTVPYKKKLLDTFRSLITQNRETHVKQVELGNRALSAPRVIVDIYPNFPVEPFPTFYLRSARAYRFLSVYLEGVLGTPVLEATTRLSEEQVAGAPVRYELQRLTKLLYGLHVLAARSVGSAPEFLPDELNGYPLEDCVNVAQQWLNGWQAGDVARDPRVATPVQRDAVTHTVSYWAVTGVKLIKARATFMPGFEPRGVTTTDGRCMPGKFVPHDYYLMVDSFAELALPDTSPPPDRAAFRRACDANPSPEALVQALK